MSFELYERRKGKIEDTEDGRTPWRLSGLSSKKGRRQTLADFGQEFWIAPTSVFMLSRKVCPFRSRFRFSRFLPASAFLLRSWKRLGCSWLGQGFQCSGNGRVLNFACREDAKKARNTKATKLNRRTGCHFFNRIRFSLFWRKEKVPDFREERSGVAVKWWASFILIEQVPNEETGRGQAKSVKRSGPLRCAFRATGRRPVHRVNSVDSQSALAS